MPSKMAEGHRLGEHKEKVASNPGVLEPSVSSRYIEKQLIESLPIWYRKHIFYLSDRPVESRLFFVTKEGIYGVGF